MCPYPLSFGLPTILFLRLSAAFFVQNRHTCAIIGILAEFCKLFGKTKKRRFVCSFNCFYYVSVCVIWVKFLQVILEMQTTSFCDTFNYFLRNATGCCWHFGAKTGNGSKHSSCGVRCRTKLKFCLLGALSVWFNIHREKSWQQNLLFATFLWYTVSAKTVFARQEFLWQSGK